MADHTAFKSHGRPIHRGAARKMGLTVLDFETDQTFQDLVLTIYHACSHVFSNSTAVKIVENHLGRAFVKQQPMMVTDGNADAARAWRDPSRFTCASSQLDWQGEVFMGAWGTGSFDNDDALEWVAELETQNLDAIFSAIEDVSALDGEYLEAPAASRALAAVEVVAAAAGHPSLALPPRVLAWLEVHPSTVAQLIQSARKTVDRVLADSELRELWEDSDNYAAWQAAVGDLRSRLGHAPPSGRAV